MVALKVRPAPHTAVDDVRQPLPVGDLQPAIQGAGNGDTVTWLPWAAQGLFQFLHGTFLFLQFFHQSINSFLCPLFFLITLFPPKESLHSWACEGKQTCHIHNDRTRYKLLRYVSQRGLQCKRTTGEASGIHIGFSLASQSAVLKSRNYHSQSSIK